MSPLVSVRYAFRCGSALDPAGKHGLATLTARLVAKGSTGSRSYKEILDAFFRMACRFEVQVDQELTVFSGTVHRDHAAEFDGIVREMLETPAFLLEDLERVRAELLNAVKVELRGSNDEELAKEVLFASLYAGHPYGHPPVGTVSGLEAITVEDVRAFYEVMRWSEGVVLPEPRELEGIEAVLIEKPDARGVAMSFGHSIPVVRGHADYHALLVAQCWLGQHRHGGRLFDSIREVRGLNYGDYTYIEYFPRGMYQFEPDPCLARRQQIFQVWLRPVEPGKALFALRLALYEIAQLRLVGMTEEDFERTRSFLAKHVKLLIKTDSLRQGYAIDSEFYGVGEYVEFITSGLARLTLANVNRAAREYLDVERFCFVAVGPGMVQLGAALQTGAASPIAYEVPQPEEVLKVDQVVERWPIDVKSLKVIPFEEVFE